MGPNTIAIKATSDDTAGTFFLSESTLEQDFPGPPLHVHVPPGTPHTFSNTSGRRSAF